MAHILADKLYRKKFYSLFLERNLGGINLLPTKNLKLLTLRSRLDLSSLALDAVELMVENPAYHLSPLYPIDVLPIPKAPVFDLW